MKRRGWTFVGTGAKIHWDALELMMLMGAEGQMTITLSPAECEVIRRIARGTDKWPRRGRGRPPDPDTDNKHKCIAYHTLVLEQSEKVDFAIEDAAEFFDVHPGTVKKLRQKWLSALRDGTAWCTVDDRQQHRLIQRIKTSKNPKSTELG